VLQIADVQAAISDHGVGPGLLHAAVFRGIGRRESPALVVAFGRSFDESDFAIFAVKVEIAVGVAERSRGDSALRLFNVAGFEIDAFDRRPSRTVQVIAEFD